MIKFRGDASDGKPVMVFGLSHQNIDRLKAGEPISFSLSELGLEGHVIIMAGETEAAIYEELTGAGLAKGIKIRRGIPPKGSLQRQ